MYLIALDDFYIQHSAFSTNRQIVNDQLWILHDGQLSQVTEAIRRQAAAMQWLSRFWVRRGSNHDAAAAMQESRPLSPT